MNYLDLQHPHPDKCFPLPIPLEEAKGMDVSEYVWALHNKPHVICAFCPQTTGQNFLRLQIRPATIEEYLDMTTMYGEPG